MTIEWKNPNTPAQSPVFIRLSRKGGQCTLFASGNGTDFNPVLLLSDSGRLWIVYQTNKDYAEWVDLGYVLDPDKRTFAKMEFASDDEFIPSETEETRANAQARPQKEEK